MATMRMVRLPIANDQIAIVNFRALKRHFLIGGRELRNSAQHQYILEQVPQVTVSPGRRVNIFDRYLMLSSPEARLPCLKKNRGCLIKHIIYAIPRLIHFLERLHIKEKGL